MAVPDTAAHHELDTHVDQVLEADAEQELAAGPFERQMAAFVENGEFDAVQMIGDAALATFVGLSLGPVDEIDDMEGAAGTGTDAISRDGNGRMGLADVADEDAIGTRIFARHEPGAKNASREIFPSVSRSPPVHGAAELSV